MKHGLRSFLNAAFALFIFQSSFAALPGQEQDIPFAEQQAVLETSFGQIIIELFPTKAPRHVAAFSKRIEEKFYVGTTFHRAVPMGIIQGGDPLSRDPSQRKVLGTGGLMELNAEFNDVSHLRGTVSAVLVPGNPDSAGSQFFICVTAQPQLDQQYTAFGRVVDGLEAIEEISNSQVDSEGHLVQRIEIQGTYLRERPPPEVPLFSDVPVEELAEYRVLMRTELGDFEIRLFPDLAPEHVRQFLRFSALEMYVGTSFHRIVPGFVIQGGMISQRQPPISQDLQKYVTPLKAEFSKKKKHIRGTVSMARTDDPDSGVDSFFIALVPNPHLDSKYTIFGEVSRGIEVVDGISQLPTRGTTPIVSFRIQSIQVKGPNR